MSGDNLYPTIDSMITEDIIKYLRERRKCKVVILDECACKYPIKSINPKICQKCGKPFGDKNRHLSKEELEHFRDGMYSFGETS